MGLEKGQSSIELIVSVIFILFILLIVSVLALQKTNESNSIKAQTDAKRICESFAANINTIAEEGHGFYKYFSLPDKLYNQEEYNLTVYGNWAELNYGNYSHITQLVTGNVSIDCLDLGSDKLNKVYNEQEIIHIICHKPELIIANNSLRPIRAFVNETINGSVKVMNFGPVPSGNFKVLFNDTIEVEVPSLESEEWTLVNFNMKMPATTGEFMVGIVIDSGNVVNESIESNNIYNDTIEIV